MPMISSPAAAVATFQFPRISVLSFSSDFASTTCYFKPARLRECQRAAWADPGGRSGRYAWLRPRQSNALGPGRLNVVVFARGLDVLILARRLDVLVLAGRLNVLILPRGLDVLILAWRLDILVLAWRLDVLVLARRTNALRRAQTGGQ